MRSSTLRAWSVFAGIAVACVVSSAAFAATWDVDTVSELQSAQANASPGDIILIQPGDYHLTRCLYITTADITLRGATGNFDDVVIRGDGMNVDSPTSNDTPIQIVNDDITIEDLTVGDCWFNGIHIHSENYADRATVRNVKIRNCGERFIKGSGSGGASWNSLVEFCVIEQTEARQTRPGHSVDPDDYIGGMDCMAAKDWIIRDNLFAGILGASGTDSRGAIFLWQHVENPLIERNVFVDCARSISMGNPYNPTGTWLVDGGIIRNNMILKGPSVALEFDYTRNLKVYNNTVYGDNASYHRTVQVYDTGVPASQTTNLDLKNNIIRGDVSDMAVGTWNVATLQAMGNIADNAGTVVTPSWFVSVAPATADLHLTAGATAALEAGVVQAEALEDYDRETRGPVGGATDMGADQISGVENANLVSTEPPVDGTLPKTQNNIIVCVFDAPITLPPSGDPLVITELADPNNDVSTLFAYSVDPNDTGDPTGATLKATEGGPVLTDLTWYQVASAPGWADVVPFEFDVCTLRGDANNSARVTTADYSEVKAHMGERTDARHDLNGSARITTADYIVVKDHMGNRAPAKP